MANTKEIGDISTASCMAALLSKGYSVSVPWGDRCRYDLVVDVGNGKLLKAQCKTARHKDNGTIVFNTASVTTEDGKYVHRSYTKEEVDIFLVYDPKSTVVYAVPVEETSRTSRGFSLRLTKPLRRDKNIHMAEDYDLAQAFPLLG